MSEVTERSVVSSDNYAELINMLKSNDEASQNLALTIMEQSDFDKSKIYLFCLLKETYKEVFGNDSKRFEEIYPELHRNVSHSLAEEATNISTLSFRKVYEIAVARNNKEELSFMLNVDERKTAAQAIVDGAAGRVRRRDGDGPLDDIGFS